MYRNLLLVLLLSTICNGTSSLVPSLTGSAAVAPPVQRVKVERNPIKKINSPYRRETASELHLSSSAMDPSMIPDEFGKQQAFDAAKNDEVSGSNAPAVEHKQSMASATFNLVKANLGSGVLALPAGIAAFGDIPSA
jgi:hypothetical protein